MDRSLSKKKSSIEKIEAVREIAEIENALIDGLAPEVLRGRQVWGAHKTVADRLGIDLGKFKDRVGSPSRNGTHWKKYKLKPDWTLYNPALDRAALKTPNISQTDRKWTLLQDENRELRRQIRELHRAHSTEDIIRDLVGNIVSAPRSPPEWMTKPPKREQHKPTPEVPVTTWSDWHLGEVVERAEVNGFNEFNLDIAEQRVERLIETTLRLAKENHTGVYPGIVVNLLGDFVSGGIHPELLQTDEDEVIPSSLRAADLIISGLSRFADEFKFVYAPGSCGNHGRHTVRPEFKRYYRKNFDWLILQIVARHFADDKRFHFDIRPSNDVHYRVYGERYLACHGDMLGVRGGDGIIGSIGPIVRGEVKQAGQSSALGFGFDKLVIGHWHQRLWLPRAIVNNALKGFDEFAMKALGAKPDRPTQALWFVHPAHGQTAHWDVYVDEKPPPVSDWISLKMAV